MTTALLSFPRLLFYAILKAALITSIGYGNQFYNIISFPSFSHGKQEIFRAGQEGVSTLLPALLGIWACREENKIMPCGRNYPNTTRLYIAHTSVSPCQKLTAGV